MKQHLKVIALFTVLIMVVLVGVGLLNTSIQSVSEKTHKQALNIEGRRLLFIIKNELDAAFQQTGRYPLSLGAEQMITERYGAGFVSAWWGRAEYQSRVEEFCPDCFLTETSYKIIAIGNLDSDPDLDVWVQSSEDKTPIQIKAD